MRIIPNAWGEITDEEFQLLVRDALRIRYAIFVEGGNASKSIVVNALCSRYGMEREWPHTALNEIEASGLSASRKVYGANGSKLVWSGDLPVPKAGDWPEVDWVYALKVKRHRERALKRAAS